MKMLTIGKVVLLSALLVSQSFAADVRVRASTDPRNDLIHDILKLALSKTDPSAKLKMVGEQSSEERDVAEVMQGKLDVMWAGVTPDKEERMQTSRIPVLKGLLGHRIFIIRNGDQHRFGQVRTLSDLKRLDAGQGTFWGDTQVLKGSNIPTVVTIKYHNLFPMLEGGRFDYFPRAVHEPWSEVVTHSDLNLVVEKELMLVYPFAMYFFVSKENTELHRKINDGLEQAIADGSFDQLFFSNEMIQKVLEQANLGERRVFRIPNPAMHPDTPYDRKEFWLDVESL